MEEAVHDALIGVIIFAFLAVFIVILFGTSHSSSIFTQIIQLFGDWFNDSRMMM